MAKKTKETTVEEIMQKELSEFDANDKIAKLEKEKLRDKKIIAEYKEREKATARALILYERKLKYLKESVTSEMLEICKHIDAVKTEYVQMCGKILNNSVRDEMVMYKDNLNYYSTKIYDICNKLEEGATITNKDRAFISNKKVENNNQPTDANSRFDRLKQEFALKIGASVTRKPGRPKKSEQSILADIGLGKKVEKTVEIKRDVENRLDEIFYQAPSAQKTISSIPQTSDSVFDFNEALNPNVSLKDIMADLMSEKEDEEIKKYGQDVERQEIDESQRMAKIELLESGFIRNPVLQTKPVKNKTIDPLMKKPTFEKRFLSIQNIVKDSNKR